MESYEAYKDSGGEWIGEIPAKWNIKRIKYLATDESSLFIDGDWIESKDIVFDESQIRYITTGNIGEGWYKEQGLAYITNEKFIALNCTEIFPGDLIISRLNPPIGRSCIVPDLGTRIVTSVDNVVLRPNTKYHKKYLMYSMCSNKYFEYTSLIARGATMQRISRSLLGDVALPIPSGVEEQTAIAKFLDRKTAEIDALIAQKERLLELYEEERTAIISHAVTKGLDPNAELKDSGVEWLGEIPDGWDELPLKRVSDVVLGKMLCSEDKGGYHEKPYLRAKNITWLKVDQNDIKRMWFSSNEISQYRLEAGDLLVSEGGEVGRTCIWNNEIGECYIQNSVHRVRFRTHKDSRYYLYLFYCLGKIGVFDAIVNRISIAHLTKEKLQQVLILKPRYNQQTAIANFLDRKMTEVDAKIVKTQRIIELQKEYRTALISEAVTGKIKVPELPTQEASA